MEWGTHTRRYIYSDGWTKENVKTVARLRGRWGGGGRFRKASGAVWEEELGGVLRNLGRSSAGVSSLYCFSFRKL